MMSKQANKNVQKFVAFQMILNITIGFMLFVTAFIPHTPLQIFHLILINIMTTFVAPIAFS